MAVLKAVGSELLVVSVLVLEEINVFVLGGDCHKRAILAKCAIVDLLVAALVVTRNYLFPVLSDD